MKEKEAEVRKMLNGARAVHMRCVVCQPGSLMAQRPLLPLQPAHTRACHHPSPRLLRYVLLLMFAARVARNVPRHVLVAALLRRKMLPRLPARARDVARAPAVTARLPQRHA